MSERTRNHWFPAKLYGWGWGFPIYWKGWLFFIGWLVSFIVGTRFLAGSQYHDVFWPHAVVMLVLPIFVCWAKGEGPK